MIFLWTTIVAMFFTFALTMFGLSHMWGDFFVFSAMALANGAMAWDLLQTEEW